MDAIRLAGPADAAACASIYAPAVTDSPASFELAPPPPDEMAARIAGVQTWAPWLVLERDGGVVGYAYAARHRERPAYQWAVDVTVYVAPWHHGAGVGRALYGALLPLLVRQGFYTAHAGITLPNAGSVALHERCGFTPVGVYPAVGYKHGAWHDVGWWRLALRAPAAEPAPPVPLPALRAAPDWDPRLDG
jgi:phosphinothricin acetyltransferase